MAVMSLVHTAVLTLLATQSLGLSRVQQDDSSSKHLGVHAEVTSDPQYAAECGEQRPGYSFAQQEIQKPGSGVVGMEPGAYNLAANVEVLKDGFMEVECVKDYMFEHGDKFGNNKFAYELHDGPRTSIVHHNLHVAKESREPMTHKVCFEFCRTVPDMNFFGIHNGRTCYCTPYYKPMAGSSAKCDATCEGQPTKMCGGKDKSTVFAMHMCNDSEERLVKSVSATEKVFKSLGAKVAFTSSLATDMEAAAVAIQGSFGEVGDSAATNLLQKAKVFAGDMLHVSADAATMATALETLVLDGKKVTEDGKNATTGPFSVSTAEDVMEKMEKLNRQGGDMVDALAALDSKATHPETLKSSAGYRSIMYFVNKMYSSASQTCSGDSLAKPLVGVSEDGCATACNSHIAPTACAGYQFFESKTAGRNLCFLFSAFKTASYYQGCGLPNAFLQTAQGAPPFDVQCKAKLSKYQGTTLAVDKSGKCKQCLRKVTAANRCYKEAVAAAAAKKDDSRVAEATKKSKK